LERLSLDMLSRTMASSFDPVQYARSRADNFNATSGDKGYLDCPKCRNRGLFAHCNPDNTLSFSECSCMKTRKALARMERSGLKGSIRDMTFEKFHASEPWQKTLKEGAVTYARSPQGWILLCGQSGSGKTHLCTAICRERLLQQEDVHYMSWREEIPRLKAMPHDDPQRDLMLKHLKTVQVLYIDDLFKTGTDESGRCRPTTADINLAFEILNYRYCNHLSTIISTELQVHQLLAVDEATGGRILERAGIHVYSIRQDKQRNYRLRNVVNV